VEKEKSLEQCLEGEFIDESLFVNGIVCKPCHLPYQKMTDIYICPQHKTNWVHHGCGNQGEYCVVNGCNERLVPLLSQPTGEDISRNIQSTLRPQPVMRRYRAKVAVLFSFLLFGGVSFYAFAYDAVRHRAEIEKAQAKVARLGGEFGVFHDPGTTNRYVVVQKSGQPITFELEYRQFNGSQTRVWSHDHDKSMYRILSFNQDSQHFDIVSYEYSNGNPTRVLSFDKKGKIICDDFDTTSVQFNNHISHFGSRIIEGTTLLSEKNPQEDIK